MGSNKGIRKSVTAPLALFGIKLQNQVKKSTRVLKILIYLLHIVFMFEDVTFLGTNTAVCAVDNRHTLFPFLNHLEDVWRHIPAQELA